jgi:hypothetical protein
LGDVAQEAVGQVLLANGGRGDLQRSSGAIKRIDRLLAFVGVSGGDSLAQHGVTKGGRFLSAHQIAMAPPEYQTIRPAPLKSPLNLNRQNSAKNAPRFIPWERKFES